MIGLDGISWTHGNTFVGIGLGGGKLGQRPWDGCNEDDLAAMPSPELNCAGSRWTCSSTTSAASAPMRKPASSSKAAAAA